MKRFGNLFDKITDLDNLKKAFECARRGKKHYKQVAKIAQNLNFYLNELKMLLESGKYELSEYKKAVIKERGKERVLHKLPFYPDRIVQWAIMLQIEPIFERHLCYHTCASLKNRGIKRAAILTRRYASQNKYCLKIDIAKFYDNISHDVLKSQLLRLFKDKRLLNLLFKVIDSFDSGVCADFEGILSGGYGGRGAKRGLPIGSYISQHLANYYLSGFDHFLKEDKRQKCVVRYMDDVCIFGGNKAALRRCLREIRAYLKDVLGLKLKSNYQIFPTRVRGVDFVGFRFFGSFVLLRKSVAKAFKALKGKVLSTCEHKARQPFMACKTLRECAKNGNAASVGLGDYGLFCAAFSYLGHIRFCKALGFFKAHFLPLKRHLSDFYTANISQNPRNLAKFQRNFECFS